MIVIKTFLEGMWLICLWYFLEAFLQLIAVAHLADFKPLSIILCNIHDMLSFLTVRSVSKSLLPSAKIRRMQQTVA
jgi:hypothetical protein